MAILGEIFMTDTTATASVLPEFRVGNIVSQTFNTFFGNFLKFFILGMLLYAPILLLGTATNIFGPSATKQIAAQDVNSFFMTFTLTMALMALSGAVMFSAVTYGSIEYQAGKPVSFSGMLKTGIKSLVPVILAAIMIMPLYILGAMLLLIPGIIVGLMFSMTVPAIVAEGHGPIAAMRRSRELTSGYKWQIFGAIFLVSLIMDIVMMVFGFGVSAVSVSMHSSAASTIGSIVSLGTGGATYGVLGACIASIYTGLRATKEGTSVDEIAEVFA
ncbi:DUF975 family protein [Kordiimonas marina]|uniref:DUF975 family protein n=1 Tax=Kordiimonas marina TaxID=2872312 RepID=UPI001FF56F61|nr:DUF975 family protein [Kordiimonas marina]MCJ9427536.1 DUF975 family protein [Kordiimonas marina]